ncbi:hypothetical protein Zmor_018420 [Zophobas morio]|uniref:Uncharacterized protein n=1 Tax=Zophobas morio TaxID=2755281 RepID=A0AA38IC93_9CUCU|nr:hypothetical protein Zmor_018420 [Zophobas morio]
MEFSRVLLLTVFYSFTCTGASKNNWDDWAENLNWDIQQRVRQSLSGLDNLWSTISQQVQQNLADKQVIVRDGVFYKCEGTISEEDGSCSGTLRKSSFESKRDFCYANINTIINNWYCISSGGGVSSGIINGNVYCNGFQNNPTLLISREDYRNLCGDVGIL